MSTVSHRWPHQFTNPSPYVPCTGSDRFYWRIQCASMLSILVVPLLLGYTGASLMPSYLARSCASDITQAVTNAIPLLFPGDNQYNIVKFNPYTEAQRLLLNNSFGKFIFNNVRLYGLDTMKVHDAQVDISNGILTAAYSFLRLTIRAASQVNFPGTPVSGYGSGGLILENLNVTQMVNFATDSSNHVFLTNATVTFTADNIDFDLQYLDTDGQEYLENNKDYFINLLRPNLCRMLSGILTSPLVAIGELVKLDDILDVTC